MKKINISQYDYSNLLDGIVKILIQNGIKATTMDDIAIKLSVSKRTLYEVFKSKNEMAVKAMAQFHRWMLEMNQKYQNESPSVIHSIIKSFVLYRDMLSAMNVDFFRYFDSLPDELKLPAKECEAKYMRNFYSLLDQAAAEGYIRDDLDYRLQFRITRIQFTLVKSLGDLFPPDISLLQVYDATVSGFLRSIASPKGLLAIDEALHHFVVHPNILND